MKAKSVKTGTSDVTLIMSVVPVTSVVIVTSVLPVKNAVTVTSVVLVTVPSVVLVTVPSVVSLANTKLQKLQNRASDFSIFARRLMLMCLACKYI